MAKKRELPEGITLRTITRKDGTTYKRYRARYPDPDAGGTAQIEQTFALLDDAKKWRRAGLSAIDKGTHIAPRAGARLLGSVIDEWRDTWQLEPKTTQGYESILSQHITPQWGSVKLSTITPDALQRWINDLATTRQPNTVLHIHSVMRSVLDLAVARNYLAKNPGDTITLPSRADNARQLFLSLTELRALVNAMPEHWRVPTLVAGLCGLRAGELWGLTRGDVDPEEGELRVRYALKDIGGRLQAGPPKTHASRKLSIPAPLIAQLENALAQPGTRVRAVKRKTAGVVNTHKVAGYPVITAAGVLDWTEDPTDPRRLLFTIPGGTPVQHTVFYERIFRPTVVKLWPAGHRLHGFRWHDLRHTAASLSLAEEKGENGLFVVMARLGHKDIRTTVNIYGHLTSAKDKQHAEALGIAWDRTDVPDPKPDSNVFELHPKGAA